MPGETYLYNSDIQRISKTTQNNLQILCCKKALHSSYKQVLTTKTKQTITRELKLK